MIKAKLIRFEDSVEGTFGIFMFGKHILYSGERPWRENQANISCIPTGTYICKWTWSPKYKRKMFVVVDVKGRSGIRFHSANYVGDDEIGFKSQVKGCIALGLGFKELGKGFLKQKAVTSSRAAIAKFEKIARGRTFQLEIVNVWGKS